MEKLAGDLLLGLKFVKLEILSTSFIDFLYEVLGELRSRSLGLKGLNPANIAPETQEIAATRVKFAITYFILFQKSS